MILLIDNYDSFTYNLVQYLRELASGEEVRVVRNDAATVDEVLATHPRAIVLSPGPSVPEVAGICVELIRRAGTIPLLGVCLGHQALGVAYGARVVRAPAPRHGKTSAIHHCGTGLFADLPEPLTVTRYHSLVVQRDSLPPELEVTSWTTDGLVMGLAHRSRPHAGVQFHPEAYLTAHGKDLLRSFLALAPANHVALTDPDPGLGTPDPGSDT
jgi:anthranilate synthase/aminodeoxychorismate synthase-like glutamine amidotransferase